MSIVKRPGSPFYYVRFTAPDGRRVFRSAQTTSKRAAQEYEAKLKSDLWREARLGESAATWRQAVVSWLKTTDHKDRAGVTEKLRWLDPHLGTLSLREIDNSTIHSIRDAKLAEGVKPGTVNRHLATVSAVLHHAKTRGWIRVVPSIPRMQEKQRIPRWLTQDEARCLVDHLRSRPRSGHIADMVEFSLATGLREANVTGLEWDRVDIDRQTAWVPPEQSKSGRPIRVPLNQLALQILRARQGIDPRWVFTYRGRKIRKAGHDGFRTAVAECQLQDVTWHTLRHTWASWHAMAGTPLQVIMELGGWTSMQMVLRYAHLAPDHLAEFAGKVVQNWCTGDPDQSLE